MSDTAFQHLAREYDRWFDENPELYNAELSTIQSLLPDFTTAVDVGTGTGRFARELGIRVGIEPSAPMAAIAASRGLCTIRGVAEDLPLFDTSYDLLTMITVTCFLRDIERAFREARRVLKPEGFLVVAFINRDSEMGQKYTASKRDSPFYKDAIFHNTAETLSLMEGAGFDELTTAQVNLPGLQEGSFSAADPETADFVVIRGRRP